MTQATVENAAKAPRLVIAPPSGWVPIDVRELWSYRDMLKRMVWRDIKIRYKQSVLGPTWVVLLPIFSTGVFSIIFGGLANLPSGGVPYAVFVYTGMQVWGLFTRGFGSTANSIIGNQHLITKVYFPRLIAPLAALVGSVLDFLFGVLMLALLLAIVGIAPPIQVVAAPLYALFALVTAMAIGIWVACLSVKFRDVRMASPFITQSLMWLSPVAYSSEIVFGNEWIPESLRVVVEIAYQMNPVFVVLEGFRWCVFDHAPGAPSVMTATSVGLTLLVLIVGLFNFRRIDATVADVI